MCKRSVYVSLLLLTLGLAQARDFAWEKAVYWDARYGTAWQGDSTATRTGLVAAGYTLLNADQLKTWMQARITDRKMSVVVLCMDAAADTVTETMSSTCTLRKYLDAGGKIVWYGDIPFYYQGNATATNTQWGDAGAPAILGFNTSGATRGSFNISTITPLGKTWGLTTTWTSERPATPTVTDNFEILAKDNAGNACAWVKHYLTGDTYRGFVRLCDTNLAGRQPLLADIIRVAEYIPVKASNPQPADGATGVGMALLQWSSGVFTTWHNVYLGTSSTFSEADRLAQQFLALTYYFYPLGFQPGTTYYWRIDEVDADGTIYQGDLWSFTATPTNAYAPTPRDGDKWIDPNSDLAWKAGQNVIKHDLFFSADKAAVENRNASTLKYSGAGVTYDPGKMAAETTYYWAVDETTLAGAKVVGNVWSFTIIGPWAGAKGEYFNGMTPSGVPALARVDPQINFNWGDPGGPGAPIGVDNFSARWTADLEIALEDTYTFITTSDDGARLWLNDQLIVDSWVDQGTTDHASNPMHLKPGVYALRMEYYENTGGAVARLSWSSTNMARQIIPAGPLELPVKAKPVYPQNGDVNVPQDVTLVWSAGEKAAKHAVYFGLDKDAVTNATTASAGIYQGLQAKDAMTFAPGALEWNTTYYWRVDEVNDGTTGSPWKGSVWSFTTANSIIVDNFESYSGDIGNEIFSFWLDNYVVGAMVQEGAQVGGVDAPYVETRAAYVHGGRQSMPLHYNNAGPKYLYSETERTFDKLGNWTTNGVKNLSLWVVGHPPAAVETAPGQYQLSANSGDVWGTADSFSFYYKTLTGDGSITAKVVSITNNLYAWAKPGVMIRESLDPASTYAFMFPTPDGRRAFQDRMTTGVSAISAHSAIGLVTLPFWVKVERKGTQFTAYYSTDGKTWITQPATENTGADASANPVTIPMGGTVYIGLALASNSVNNLSTVATFSDVTTSTSVTGAWKTAVVGTDFVNTPEKFYVAIEDSTGKVAIASDPALVNAATWTQWNIPLSSLTGVNLAKVKKMYIGVGDRKAPVAGGSGNIWIDDIRVTK